MAVAEREPRERVAARGSERWLSGWGRTAPSRAAVFRPRDAEDIAELLALAAVSRGGAIARGAGRSYGDAAQNGGGAVLDTTGLARILAVDHAHGIVSAQAGVTVAQLTARLAADGLTLPVVPGTRHVTLAGAIASDIHGKNHHRDGAIARHVASLSLCTPAQGLLEVSPDSDPELFYATLGGMGLTGVIVQATLRAAPLQSPWLALDTDRSDGLEQTLELMSGEESHGYSVAWLDLLAEGPRMGRAVIGRADGLPGDRVAASARDRRARRGSDPAGLQRRAPLAVPPGLPGLLSPAAVRAFNALRWRAAPRRERGRAVAFAPYFFPLDGLAEWNRLYGPAGLVQYQFVVPDGEEATLRRCFELIRARRLPVYLAVLKRFGPAFGGPLSFPIAGWTLAIDLPAAARGLHASLDELDRLVAACGGRVYLTKDARMRPDVLRAMYPRLPHFEAVHARVDPDGVLRSDLARRLRLCGAAR